MKAFLACIWMGTVFLAYQYGHYQGGQDGLRLIIQNAIDHTKQNSVRKLWKMN